MTKILKIHNCLTCPYKASSWRRASDGYVCTNPINQDEDGYCPQIEDLNTIADFCEMEDDGKGLKGQDLI